MPLFQGADEIINEFVNQGLVPPNCRRIIIDITCDRIISVFYEVIGDKRLKVVGLPDKLLKADIKPEHITEKSEG